MLLKPSVLTSKYYKAHTTLWFYAVKPQAYAFKNYARSLTSFFFNFKIFDLSTYEQPKVTCLWFYAFKPKRLFTSNI